MELRYEKETIARHRGPIPFPRDQRFSWNRKCSLPSFTLHLLPRGFPRAYLELEPCDQSILNETTLSTNRIPNRFLRLSPILARTWWRHRLLPEFQCALRGRLNLGFPCRRPSQKFQTLVYRIVNHVEPCEGLRPRRYPWSKKAISMITFETLKSQQPNVTYPILSLPRGRTPLGRWPRGERPLGTRMVTWPTTCIFIEQKEVFT